MTTWHEGRDAWRARKREWKEMKREWKAQKRGGAWTSERGEAPVADQRWQERFRNWQARDAAEPRRRFGWRVWFLPLFLWPLVLDIPIELFRGHENRVVGAALGIGLAWLAAARMARGIAGDTDRGAKLLGVASGLSAGLAAGIAWPLAVGLGFATYAGARLITDDLAEVVPPPKPATPPPPPEPGFLEGPKAQLARIRELAPRLPEAPRLMGAADAMAAVLDDITERPQRQPEARRFLAVHLDGLSRIVDRLEAGAEPPAGLPDLLETLTQSATRLRRDLRQAETEALDIQVKVLSDRLKQEGL
jgi:hypothetical protein